jgi:hypothetical protein
MIRHLKFLELELRSNPSLSLSKKVAKIFGKYHALEKEG